GCIPHTSPRRARKFVAVNCAAMPESLLESELFGHVKGAFTGALRDRRGVFEEASGGTIFLDEIGEMSPTMQAKVLRVVEDGIVRPVGASESVRVDVRLICATHRDLKAEVSGDEALAAVAEGDGKLRERLDRIEQLLILQELRRHGDNRTRTARHLGISVRALQKKIGKYGLRQGGE